MMNDKPLIKMYAMTLDCKAPNELAKFYAALLSWDVVYSDDGFAVIGPSGAEQGAYPGIMFQCNPGYAPPVWPDAPEAQQQMAHLDLAVNDLDGAVAHAIACGATEAAEQFSESWRVMLDPSGHPFCLCPMQSVIDSPHFALL